ncbi:MAG: hypothetical protein Q8W44_08760 [Candidatus Palauibacterales bacterium]|nr:hypothetical protein [Candidatus Palauibacterales bacterium]
MRVLKRLAPGAVSLFLVAYSWDLLVQLRALESPLSIAGAAFWGWLLALSVTGIFAFAGFGFPTERLLPDSYYRVGEEDRLLALYRITGAHWMKPLLATAFRRLGRNQGTYFSGTRSGLDDFDRRTRKSEFGHLAAFVLIVPVSLVLLLSGQVLVAFVALLANWIGNLCPVVIQRQHRFRIQRVRARQQQSAV